MFSFVLWEHRRICLIIGSVWIGKSIVYARAQYYLQFPAPTGGLGMYPQQVRGGTAVLSNGGPVIAKYFLFKDVPLSFFKEFLILQTWITQEITFHS